MDNTYPDSSLLEMHAKPPSRNLSVYLDDNVCAENGEVEARVASHVSWYAVLYNKLGLQFT